MNLNHVIASRPTKTIYRDGNFAVKVFHENYSKADILNEALNHARVEEIGLNVPRIESVIQVDGKWAIVSDFIEGKTIAQLIEEQPDRKAALIERLADIQTTIHARKAPTLNKLRDKMNKKISAADLDATTRYDLHTRLESMPAHEKLCHGDFNPSNVIITEEEAPYVLDWAHATQGNASADAARTYLLFCLDGDRETAELYLDSFCKKSDTAKQYVKNWLPIVAASQSVKGKPEEREFLLSWVDVVDYV